MAGFVAWQRARRVGPHMAHGPRTRQRHACRALLLSHGTVCGPRASKSRH